jgi:hypothetical protein
MTVSRPWQQQSDSLRRAVARFLKPEHHLCTVARAESRYIRDTRNVLVLHTHGIKLVTQWNPLSWYAR